MKLNELIKTNKKKIRVGRGIGSGKGKTSGRGHKGQKSRSGVAIKSFEGGQMPLYRRLPKRGFKSLNKGSLYSLNISTLESFCNKNKIDLNTILNIKVLKEKKLIKHVYTKLKILGKGDIKSKFNLSVDYVSKQAKEKIEKAGGKINIINKK
jgi:large subunit ribosomal protein L15